MEVYDNKQTISVISFFKEKIILISLDTRERQYKTDLEQVLVKNDVIISFLIKD